MNASSEMLDYASSSRPRPRLPLDGLATAIAFFGAISTAGGLLVAAGIEWLDSTFRLDQTHEVPVNLHVFTAGLAIVAVIGMLSTASACCLTVRKARRFSLWVAAAQLALFPPGTILAALTFVALSGNSAEALYRYEAKPS